VKAEERSEMNIFQRIHRDVSSIIIGILVLAGLIASLLAIANPIT
jgi:hypothetical protein